MPKLECIPFGRRLIETRDLDPVYVLLWDCDDLRNNRRLMEHWLLAYWAFYHMGTASWITDGVGTGHYWSRFETAASSKVYPRCTERRHYRGEAALKSFNYLQSQGIEYLFEPFQTEATLPARDVMYEVKRWTGFGPWIAFKVADMLERLGLTRIEFKTEDVYLFESPRQGAERLAQSLSSSVQDPYLNTWAVETLIDAYSDMRGAPPRYERAVGVQEAETVLCKYKSYSNNKYKIGEDIESCQKCLQQFVPKSPLAQSLYRAGTRTLWNSQPEECSTKVLQ